MQDGREVWPTRVGLFAPPGTSLRASDRMASAIERQVLEIEGVRSVTRRTGRAERDEHAEPVSNSEIEVTVKPGYRKDEVRDQIGQWKGLAEHLLLYSPSIGVKPERVRENLAAIAETFGPA